MLSGHFHHEILRLHNEYGPVIRVAPQELIYSDAVIWRDAYTHRPGHAEFPRSTIVDNVNGATDIISANGEAHGRFRGLLSRAFSEQSLRTQESRILGHVDLLIRQLHKRSTYAGSVDLVQWFSWTVFDIVGDLAFGESFGCLKSGHLHPWINSTFGSLKTIMYFDVLRDYNLVSSASLFVRRSLQEARFENFKYASDTVKKRIQYDNTRGDFLDTILGLNEYHSSEPEPKNSLTFDELVNNCSILVSAGSLSMAALLPGCLNLLLGHPRILQKVTAEVCSRYTSSSEINMLSTSNSLPYLLAVLNESMRLYPPNPTLPGRVVPPKGDIVDGVFLPGGTHLQIVPYAAYKLESNFKRPSEFIPERWLGDPEFANDKREVCKPFTAGSRNCIGQNLAYAEMRLIIAKFLWHFDIKFSPKMEGRNWAAEQETYLLWEKIPLWVYVSPRTQ